MDIISSNNKISGTASSTHIAGICPVGSNTDLMFGGDSIKADSGNNTELIRFMPPLQ